MNKTRLTTIWFMLMSCITKAYSQKNNITEEADLNNDNAVDVTDLSELIDIVLGKSQPVDEPVPTLWYAVGACIGDGSWTNTAEAIGTSMLPLYATSESGVYEYVGYLTTAGFKLVGNPGLWGYQWGSSDGGLTPVANDQSSQNLCVPENGFYRVVLDTNNNLLTIDEVEAPERSYGSIGMPGRFQNWAPADPNVQMNSFDTFEGAPNHNWTLVITMSETERPGVKFAANGDWSVNWGSEGWPTGYGTQDGPNIPYQPGTYRVFFNDITGAYRFIAQ